MPDSTTATVILPVFNGLHVVRPCLESIIRWTDLGQHRLLIVNDASDEHTSSVLRDWADEYPEVDLIENDRNLGFVRAVNRGLRTITSDFAVILNSDTCVTPRWLDKMIACMVSDRRIGVASPISNFAPYLRIEMLPGLNYIEMAGLVEYLAEPTYPDVTTPEGFCYMISHDCLSRIGYFDVVFEDGYGEESDYAMRANYFGFRTVCADDTYVYHRGRASFGHDRRAELYEQNKGIFISRWQNRYPTDFADFRKRDPLGRLRDAIESHGDPNMVSAFQR